jgi:hypothetical protein
VSLLDWWDADASASVKLVLAAAALVVLIWEQRLGKRGGAAADPRPGKLLRVLGGLAVLAYFNFGSFHFGGIFVHLWDGLHHTLGARYVDELGYDGLYECIAVADAEQPGAAERAAGRVLTDLRTNQLTMAADVVAHPERCRDRFSPARWSAFTADVAFFRDRFPDADWQRVTGDHGFNASPVWLLAARPLVGDAPLTDARLTVLATLDPLLMLAALAAVARAFGLRGAALVAIVWAAYFPARLWWTGGSLLRWDWLAALLAGVAFARRGRPATAGALLAYAALSRVFPAFALAGVALAALLALVRRRAIDRAHARLLLGAAVTAALLVPLAGLARPAHGWRDFARNVAKHTSVASANRMGLAVVVAFDPDARQRVLARRTTDVRGAWERAQEQTLRARRPLWLVLVALGIAAVALATREQPAWAACVLGLLLVPLGRPLACYYYAFVALLPLLAERRAEVGGIAVALALASGLVARLPGYEMDEQYAAQSLLVLLALPFIASYFIGRWRASPPPQAPPRPPIGPEPSQPLELPIPPRPPTGPAPSP